MNMKKQIRKHLQTLGSDAINDVATGQWDEAMTDALYACCGAATKEDMAKARLMASNAVRFDRVMATRQPK